MTAFFKTLTHNSPVVLSTIKQTQKTIPFGGNKWVIGNAPTTLLEIVCNSTGQKLLAAPSSTSHNLLTSNDYGNTWTTQANSPGDCHVIASDASGNKLVAIQNLGAGGLFGPFLPYTSTDGGNNWSNNGVAPIGSGAVGGTVGIPFVVLSSANGSTLNFLLSNDNGTWLWRSINGGVTWANTGWPNTVITSIFNASSNTYMYAIQGTSVLASNDSGNTWKTIYNNVGARIWCDITGQHVSMTDFIAHNIFSDDYGNTFYTIPVNKGPTAAGGGTGAALGDGGEAFYFFCTDASGNRVGSCDQNHDTYFTVSVDRGLNYDAQVGLGLASQQTANTNVCIWGSCCVSADGQNWALSTEAVGVSPTTTGTVRNLLMGTGYSSIPNKTTLSKFSQNALGLTAFAVGAQALTKGISLVRNIFVPLTATTQKLITKIIQFLIAPGQPVWVQGNINSSCNFIGFTSCCLSYDGSRKFFIGHQTGPPPSPNGHFAWGSNNFGQNWTQIQLPNVAPLGIGGAQSEGETDCSSNGQYVLCIGTAVNLSINENHFFVSNDYGNSWNDNFKITGSGGGGVQTKVSSDGSFMICSPAPANAHFWTSTDHGVTWTQQTGWSSVADAGQIDISANGKFVYATDLTQQPARIWTSNNYAATGSWVNQGNPCANSTPPIGICCDNTGQYVITCSLQIGANEGLIMTSNNFGVSGSWVYRASPAPIAGVKNFSYATCDATATYIYVAGLNAANGPPYFSNDGGVTWAQDLTAFSNNSYGSIKIAKFSPPDVVAVRASNTVSQFVRFFTFGLAINSKVFGRVRASVFAPNMSQKLVSLVRNFIVPITAVGQKFVSFTKAFFTALNASSPVTRTPNKIAASVATTAVQQIRTLAKISTSVGIAAFKQVGHSIVRTANVPITAALNKLAAIARTSTAAASATTTKAVSVLRNFVVVSIIGVIKLTAKAQVLTLIGIAAFKQVAHSIVRTSNVPINAALNKLAAITRTGTVAASISLNKQITALKVNTSIALASITRLTSLVHVLTTVTIASFFRAVRAVRLYAAVATATSIRLNSAIRIFTSVATAIYVRAQIYTHFATSVATATSLKITQFLKATATVATAAYSQAITSAKIMTNVALATYSRQTVMIKQYASVALASLIRIRTFTKVFTTVTLAAFFKAVRAVFIRTSVSTATATRLQTFLRLFTSIGTAIGIAISLQAGLVSTVMSVSTINIKRFLTTVSTVTLASFFKAARAVKIFAAVSSPTYILAHIFSGVVTTVATATTSTRNVMTHLITTVLGALNISFVTYKQFFTQIAFAFYIKLNTIFRVFASVATGTHIQIHAYSLIRSAATAATTVYFRAFTALKAFASFAVTFTWNYVVRVWAAVATTTHFTFKSFGQITQYAFGVLNFNAYGPVKLVTHVIPSAFNIFKVFTTQKIHLVIAAYETDPIGFARGFIANVSIVNNSIKRSLKATRQAFMNPKASYSVVFSFLQKFITQTSGLVEQTTRTTFKRIASFVNEKVLVSRPLTKQINMILNPVLTQSRRLTKLLSSVARAITSRTQTSLKAVIARTPSFKLTLDTPQLTAYRYFFTNPPQVTTSSQHFKSNIAKLFARLSETSAAQNIRTRTFNATANLTRTASKLFTTLFKANLLVTRILTPMKLITSIVVPRVLRATSILKTVLVPLHVINVTTKTITKKFTAVTSITLTTLRQGLKNLLNVIRPIAIRSVYNLQKLVIVPILAVPRIIKLITHASTVAHITTRSLIVYGYIFFITRQTAISIQAFIATFISEGIEIVNGQLVKFSSAIRGGYGQISNKVKAMFQKGRQA